MDPNAAWGHSAAAPQQQMDPVAPIIFTQSQIEACLLRGLSKWEIVAELQNSNQIRQSTTLDVWSRLEQQNQPFFDAYDQFIKLRNQVQDFNDVMAKLFEESNSNKDLNSSQQQASSSSQQQPGNNNGQEYDPNGRGRSSKEDSASQQQRLSPSSMYETYGGRQGSKGDDSG
jgi:uncharacterized protein (TIGR01589 family)